MVYVESNDDLYMTTKSNVKHKKPRVTISLPLMSQEKDIYVPKEEDDVGKWVATIKLNKVKGYWFQRYLGKVRTLYVFDSPV